MGRKPKHTSITLEAGQIWRTEKGFLEIIRLGKTLAHYRHTKAAKQKGSAMLLTQIATLTSIIQAGKAELAAGPTRSIPAVAATPTIPTARKRLSRNA